MICMIAVMALVENACVHQDQYPGAKTTKDEIIWTRLCEFRLPFQSTYTDIRKVVLFYSTNKGESWHKVGEYGPDQTSFAFIAPKNGEYWFSVQVELINGVKNPLGVEALRPDLKVGVLVRELQ